MQKCSLILRFRVAQSHNKSNCQVRNRSARTPLSITEDRFFFTGLQRSLPLFQSIKASTVCTRVKVEFRGPGKRAEAPSFSYILAWYDPNRAAFPGGRVLGAFVHRERGRGRIFPISPVPHRAAFDHATPLAPPPTRFSFPCPTTNWRTI